jgi:hypothetical protein
MLTWVISDRASPALSHDGGFSIPMVNAKAGPPSSFFAPIRGSASVIGRAVKLSGAVPISTAAIC